MNTKPITTSLIIVNYNGFEITKDCLESIFANRGAVEFEVILVDNASTDSSAEKLEAIFANQRNFRVVRKTKNDFLTPAYNRGFQESRGELIVFMNNDLIVTKNWLTELQKTFDDKETGIAGVSLLSWKQKNQVDSRGCRLTFLGYGYQIDAGKVHEPKQGFREVFFVPGSVLAIRRELFEKVGGFDETYRGNYEDVDLAWKIRLLGYQVSVAEKAIVYHRGSWTVERYLGNTRSSFLCRKNRLATVLKNAGKAHLIFAIPVYFLLQLITFLKEYLLEGNLQLALTTPQAIVAVLKNARPISKKRKLVQSYRTISDWPILKKMSLL